MGDEKGFRVYEWIIVLLREYFKANPIGRAIYHEVGFKINHPTKLYAVRKPDIGVILYSNPTPFVEGEMSYQGCFDMCIESLSFSSLKEIKRDTVDKKKEYAWTKIPEYFILDSRGKETMFYRLNSNGNYDPISITGGVVASQVLPGFQFRISDLDDLPELESLMDDPVYSSFVLLSLQKERQAKEEAKQRAENAETLLQEERQAKTDVEQRILELEARLKQLDQS